VTNPTDDLIKEQLISLTRDLMLVPTTASRPEEINRGFQFIKNHLETLKSIEITEYVENTHPSMVALPKGIVKPEILICAHLDVVDYPTPEAFQSKIEKGRIVGPGAGDMKGSLAIGLQIFRFFHSNHPGISLGLAITSDEETGGTFGMNFLVNKKNLRCGIALVPDGGSLNKVTTHEKGVIHAKVISKGQFSHASRPWEGDNALVRLVRNLQRLETIFDKFKLKDSRWHATCSPTMIGSTNDVINRIPDYAEAGLDIRFPQPFTSQEILEKIKDPSNESFDIEVLIKAEPSELKPDPLYLKVTAEVTGEKVEMVQDHGGSDARFFASKGIPAIVSRPLVGHLHSEEEWIDINSMYTLYRIYERYISKKLL